MLAIFFYPYTYIYTDSIHNETNTKLAKSKERTNTKREPTNSVNFWLELLAAADQLMLSQLKTIACSISLVNLDLKR